MVSKENYSNLKANFTITNQTYLSPHMEYINFQIEELINFKKLILDLK